LTPDSKNRTLRPVLSSAEVMNVPLPARQLRVLIIAELANPDWVSVPLVGWSHFHALSKVVDGHLVTHVINGDNIRKAGLPPGRLTLIDPTTLERPLMRIAQALRGKSGGGLSTMTALKAASYYYFEHMLWQIHGDEIRQRRWDVVHRLTPLSPVTPSLLAAKCAQHGVPFVLGPLNGGLPWPKGFQRARTDEHEWLTYVRDAYKLLPGYRTTRRFAAAIITGSRDTRNQISAKYRSKTVYIPENAIDPARFVRQRGGPVPLPLRVAFVGRLTLYKGVDMLIEAAAPLIRRGVVQLDVIGDGPQAQPLRALAAREGLPESLFAGWVQHEKLQERLSQSDVFAFPSIREFGGAVALEAMALGLVPIVVDYGGPGEIVTPATGIALPMGSRSEIVAALRAALERLVANPGGIRAMGARGRERVMRSFTWDVKARQVLEVYRWALGQRDKPDFGMPLPDAN
jgi:glycosyltransferase involved in cell wall biosynthesis